MHQRDGNGSAPEPAARDRIGQDSNPVSALAARVDEIDGLLRAASGIVDEKSLKELRRTIDAFAKRDPKFEERVSNRVDVMADRVETLAKTVSTSSGAVVAKDGEIVQLRRELEAALARVDAAAKDPARGASPAELTELGRRVDELTQLTKQKLPRGLESRVAELADKFTLLAQRVDSVSTTVSTTASGLARRDGDVTALRRAVETGRDQIAGELAALQRAVDPRPLTELQGALKEHADETGRQQYAIRQLIAKTGASVDSAMSRLDALTASLTSTTDRVADTETGLAAFRTYFEKAGGQLSAHVAQHQHTLTALSARSAELEQADAEAARVLHEHVSTTAGNVDKLAGGLDSLADTVSEASSRIGASEESMSALRADAAAEGERFGSLLAELKQDLVTIAERTAALEQADQEVARSLDQRILAAGERIDALAARLDPLSAAVATTTERVEAREADLDALESRMREATSRVDGLVGDLSRALAEFPDPSAVTETLDVRFGEHAALVSSYEDRLSLVEAKASEQLRTTDSLSAELERQLAERIRGLQETVAESVSSTDERADEIAARLDALAAALTVTDGRISESHEGVSALRDYVDDAGKRLGSQLAENKQALVTIAERTAALEQADGEVTLRLDERISAAGERVHELAERVESATSSLGEKENELAALQHSFTDSSTRIEAIVDDIREALSTVSEPGSASLDDLAERLERIEMSTRRSAETNARTAGELTGRIEAIDKRVAAVAAEVARAKTLWPVALRSLEARLDDAVHGHRTDSTAAGDAASTSSPDGPADDLLAGLRDSLQAMETVAAEMARASDTLGEPDQDHADADEPPAETEAPVAAPGATIVPLRIGEP